MASEHGNKRKNQEQLPLLGDRQGEVPGAENERLLRDLAVVVDELEKVYDPEVIPDWLFADRIGGPSPMDLLRADQLAEVLHLINAAKTGAYG